MNPTNSITEILDVLATQKQQGENSLIVTIEPNLLEAAMSGLRDYRTLFAPVIPGETDTAPIYAAYEQMRQANPDLHAVLLLVECQSIDEYREAVGRLPIRHSSDWRHLDPEWRALNKAQ